MCVPHESPACDTCASDLVKAEKDLDFWRTECRKLVKALKYTKLNWVEKQARGDKAKRDVVDEALSAHAEAVKERKA